LYPKVSALIGLVAGVYSSFVAAYEPDRAINNFAHELVECAVYFTLSAEGMRRAERQDSAASSEAAADRALSAALLFSDSDTVAARQQLEVKTQTSLIKSDFANFSVLIAIYGERCRVVVGNPRARLLYWLDKVGSRN
jgi:hypothetical protein